MRVDRVLLLVIWSVGEAEEGGCARTGLLGVIRAIEAVLYLRHFLKDYFFFSQFLYCIDSFSIFLIKFSIF